MRRGGMGGSTAGSSCNLRREEDEDLRMTGRGEGRGVGRNSGEDMGEGTGE